MTRLTGNALLQRVSERIIGRWLETQGRVGVERTGGLRSFGGRSVDLTYSWQGGLRRIKVKADPYFGTDPMRISDRALTFYRASSGAYAFESVANAATREPGWIVNPAADELFYHFITLSQHEDEVAALAVEPDDVFFAEIAVDADELIIMPMGAVARWFEANADRYTPRPVMSDGASAWYRLVPRGDLERAVDGVRVVGPVMASLLR